MKLTVNGNLENHENIRTAIDLLSTLGVLRERVAVMVNGDVIRRADLETTRLHDGDAVEVITMVGGG
jgi:thiamine biosynthesis protein ThiS